MLKYLSCCKGNKPNQDVIRRPKDRPSGKSINSLFVVDAEVVALQTAREDRCSPTEIVEDGKEGVAVSEVGQWGRADSA